MHKTAVYVSITYISCLFGQLLFSCKYPIHTPANTKFAFDFHHVVVQPGKDRWKKILSWHTIPQCNPQFPYLLLKLPSLIYNHATSEEYIALFNRYNQRPMAQLIASIGSDLELINGTVTIIKELKKQGYEVDMLSNIGTTELTNLVINEPFTSLIKLFNNVISVDYLFTTNPLKKPNPLYYAEYLQLYNPHHKQIIFVDDMAKNIQAAQEADMIGILFTTPTQLQSELTKREIIPACSFSDTPPLPAQ